MSIGWDGGGGDRALGAGGVVGGVLGCAMCLLVAQVPMCLQNSTIEQLVGDGKNVWLV